MPPNESALAKALAALDEVELVSFTATPASIAPFGESELRWRVNAPSGVRIELDGQQVPRIGSKVVHPGATHTYSLVARASTLSAAVGQVTVVVNLDACILLGISEEEVNATLMGVIDGLLALDPSLSLRSTPVVDVTPAGIVMKLRFEVAVPHFRNPDFDIDALIGLAPDGDGIRPFFLQFWSDLHLSFFEEALAILVDATAGLLAGGPFIHIALAQGETQAKADARRDILNGVGAAIEAFLSMAPGFRPHAVFLRDDGIDVRMCPKPGAKINSFRHPDFRLTAVRLGRRGAAPKSRTGYGRRRRSTPARKTSKPSVRRRKR